MDKHAIVVIYYYFESSPIIHSSVTFVTILRMDKIDNF